MTDNTPEDHQRAGVAKEPSEDAKLIRRGSQLYVRIDGNLVKVDASAEIARRHRFGVGKRIYEKQSASSRTKAPRPTAENTPHAVEGRMYIASSDAAEVLNVIAAYRDFVRHLGVRRVEVVEAEPGSVWIKFKQWTTMMADKKKARIVAMQLVGLVEGATTEKFQAENTATHMESVANLAEKTKHLKSFSFESEPLQYVQWEDGNGDTHARARVVNSRDIALKRLDDDIVRDPQKMLEQLDEAPDAIKPEPEN